MLVNIIDYRTNPYKTTINAVFEPAAQDNSCEDANQYQHPGTWNYKEKANITIAEAITIANECDGATTLYMYDI